MYFSPSSSSSSSFVFSFFADDLFPLLFAFVKSFSACQLLGNTAGRAAKTSLRAVGHPRRRRRRRARRVRVFCFAGTTSPEKLLVSFLCRSPLPLLVRVSLASPLSKPRSLFPAFFESVPASLRKLFNSWRATMTQVNSPKLPRKSTGMLFASALLALLPRRSSSPVRFRHWNTSCVLVREKSSKPRIARQ